MWIGAGQHFSFMNQPQAAGKKSTHNPILAFLEMSRKLSDEQLNEAVEEAKQDAAEWCNVCLHLVTVLSL